MPRTIDLGWALARAELTDDNAQLVICEPESEDSPAKSLTITGIEWLAALADLCVSIIADREAADALQQGDEK